MEKKGIDQDPRSRSSKWFDRFFELEGKPAAMRTTSENYERTWILKEILRRIETATQAPSNHQG